ncbi:MAG: adenosylcobinamide-GDP ribazoletransferase [Pelagimonas sp.]|uniref:adenosylcobinamide-GDP ribazoletransferase n=1 Tax=Pelagimonas sp. TaxID=2073170 RepID=UPI003D6A5F25
MTPALRLEGQLFQLAVRFLTSLPVSHDLPESDDLGVRANKYFPLVGGLVGGIGAGVFWLCCLWLPQSGAVIVSLIATLLVTGAFHEEGLANAIEGISRGSGRGQVLEMMAQPGLGLFGALAVALTLGLKLVLLAHLSVEVAGGALILGHMIGMMAVVHIIATTPYAHSNGLQVAAPYITGDGYRFALATAVLVLVVSGYWFGFWPPVCALFGGVVLGQMFRSAMLRKLGGYNGDCLGAVMQLAELGAYLGLTIWF